MEIVSASNEPDETEIGNEKAEHIPMAKLASEKTSILQGDTHNAVKDDGKPSFNGYLINNGK